MMEEKVDYTFDTLEDTADAFVGKPDTVKIPIRWWIEIDLKGKVIEIRPGDSGCISLYGAQDARNFINEIKEAIQGMFQQ